MGIVRRLRDWCHTRSLGSNENAKKEQTPTQEKTGADAREEKTELGVFQPLIGPWFGKIFHWVQSDLEQIFGTIIRLREKTGGNAPKEKKTDPDKNPPPKKNHIFVKQNKHTNPPKKNPTQNPKNTQARRNNKPSRKHDSQTGLWWQIRTAL